MDKIVWKILLDGLQKQGNLHLCTKTIRIVESRNFRISLLTYDILGRALSAAGCSIEAEEITDRMKVLRQSLSV